MPRRGPAPDGGRDRPAVSDRPDAGEKALWLLLRLLTRVDGGPSVAGAARLAGFTPRWGRALVHRYNADRPDAQADGRRSNGAAPGLPSDPPAERLAPSIPRRPTAACGAGRR